MTKRIIGLILVIVMLSLSLVGCGYSLANDDLSAYATLSEEQKAALLEKIKKITVEDGDFTTDPAIREQKVLDTVYEALASASSDEAQKTDGVPGPRDTVHYCYYATADFDGTTVVLYAANMKQSSAASVQLGKSGLEGVAAAVAGALKDYDFKNGTYETVTTGKAAEGDRVYVTYTYSYTPAGATTPTKGTNTNELMIIGAAPAEGAAATSFASYLNGKSFATAIKDGVTINEEGKGEVTYSGVTINWKATGDEVTSFKDVTFTEDKYVSDTTGKSRNLNGKELTYHIYPVHYKSVPELNASNIITYILGEDITADAIYRMVLGDEWANLDEEEDAAKIEERATLLAKYKTENQESIADVVDKILKTYTEAEELEESLEEANDNLSKLEEAVTDAQSKVDAATEVTEDLTKALEAAKKARDEAQAGIEKTDALIKEKEAERKTLTAAIVNIKVDEATLEQKITSGYKRITYDYLQSAYNTEMKMNLAKEIYFFLENAIEVVDVPEKAVDATYDRLVENYEYKFYTGSDTATKETYYKKYNGSFKDYLKASVNADYSKTTTTYKEALEVLKAEAVEYVKPIVRIYVAAEAYDVLVTDKEFKEYKQDTDNNYSYNEYYYGENSVRYAHQFDKLMNYFLAYDEKKAEQPDANGYTSITFDYKLVEEIVFGEPESEKKTDEKAE